MLELLTHIPTASHARYDAPRALPKNNRSGLFANQAPVPKANSRTIISLETQNPNAKAIALFQAGLIEREINIAIIGPGDAV